MKWMNAGRRAGGGEPDPVMQRSFCMLATRGEEEGATTALVGQTGSLRGQIVSVCLLS